MNSGNELSIHVPTLLRKSKLVLLKKGGVANSRLATPTEHLAMQSFPCLVPDYIKDFPFKSGKDYGLDGNQVRKPFTDSHVVSVAGNAMNYHQLVSVMLFKLATTTRI